MLHIRYATPDDIPLIRQLSLQVWPQTYASILSGEQISYMLERMYSPDALEQQFAEGHQFILVCDEKEPVGFASYSETTPGIYKLHKIYILTNGQGKGIGKFVIHFIINELKVKEATALQLNVNRHNKAKSFYERLGFAVIRMEDIDIGNGFFMNDYVMEYQLRGRDK